MTRVVQEMWMVVWDATWMRAGLELHLQLLVTSSVWSWGWCCMCSEAVRPCRRLL